MLDTISDILEIVGKVVNITFKLFLVLFALATWGVVDIVDMIDEI